MAALFIREFKKVLFSIPYVLLAAVFVLFAVSQPFADFRVIDEPQPGQQNYGTKPQEAPELIMPAALESLYAEYQQNNYVAYPIGFYKNVKLGEADSRRMAEILAELTGMSVEELLRSSLSAHAYGEIEYRAGEELQMNPDGSFTFLEPDDPEGNSGSPQEGPRLASGLTYERFRTLMHEADTLIGGGSNYELSSLVGKFGRVPLTYEEALENYRLTAEYDRFSGAYARLFCDYMCLMASLMPVFVAVACSLRDRRSGIEELIFSRRTGSIRIVCIRYLAQLTACILPLLVLAAVGTLKVSALYPNTALDSYAFFKYALGWLTPSVMIALAMGMFLTELTRTPIAIAVQGAWWFFDVSAGLSQMSGGYAGLPLSPRHNTLGNTQGFLNGFSALLTDRLFYAGLSVALVALTVYVYENRRGGILHGANRTRPVHADRPGESAA